KIDGRMIGPTWREIGKISSGIEWTCAGIGRMSTTTVPTPAGIGKISGATAGTFMRIGTITARIFNNNEEGIGVPVRQYPVVTSGTGNAPIPLIFLGVSFFRRGPRSPGL